MYGNRKYSRLNREVKPVDPSAIPTFLCPRCNRAKSTATGFVELTAIDKDGLLLNHKICSDCIKSLQEWLKGK